MCKACKIASGSHWYFLYIYLQVLFAMIYASYISTCPFYILFFSRTHIYLGPKNFFMLFMHHREIKMLHKYIYICCYWKRKYFYNVNLNFSCNCHQLKQYCSNCFVVRVWREKFLRFFFNLYHLCTFHNNNSI